MSTADRIESENTKRHRIIVEQRQQRLENWKLWIGAGSALIAGGFAAAMYLRQFAMTADVKGLAKELESHRLEEAARMSAVEALQRNIEEDYHWQRAQLAAVAERVGAERVAPPDHALSPKEKTK